MKKSILFSLMFSGLLIAGALLFVPAHHVLAQRLVIDIAKSSDPRLVTCGLVGSGQFCDMCDLIVLVQNFLNFIWKSAWVIAAGMMVYGGFYMILPSFGAGGSGMFEKGKKILTNVAWGLVIVFFAWIMIDTIIKVVAGGVVGSTAPAGLFSGSQSFGPWNKIQCTRAPERAPLALLEIPPALRCLKDAQGNVLPNPDAIPGFNACDPLVAQNIQDMLNGNPSNFTGTNVAGTCEGATSKYAAMVRDHGSFIAQQASANGVPPQCAFALLATESSGDTGAMSPKGASGLGQIMPATAKGERKDIFGNMTDAQIQARLQSDPRLTIEISMRYYGKIYNGLGKRDCVLASAGYNAGPGNLNPPGTQGTTHSCTGVTYAYECVAETTQKMVPGMSQNLTKIRNNQCPTSS